MAFDAWELPPKVFPLKTAPGLVAEKMRDQENLSFGFNVTNAPFPNTSDDPLKGDGQREKEAKAVIQDRETARVTSREKFSQGGTEEGQTTGRETLRTKEEPEKTGMTDPRGKGESSNEMPDHERTKENVPLPRTRSPLGRGLH